MGGLSDGALLERFVARNDGAAFEILLERHGPMVWGVCHRVLGNHHDAEDAFQATFLVLARKAAAVCPREAVAGWLHGVATRTAQKARVISAKRRARETPMPRVPDLELAPREPWDELAPLLDQALGRLPERYRLAIVLCDLEGLSRREAAIQLGWPEGTVASRLARARAVLARLLAQRGLTLSGATIALLLAEHSASAADVPRTLLAATARAVAGHASKAAAGGAMSARVATLTDGVLIAMSISRMKTVLALLFTVIGLGVFAGTLAEGARGIGGFRKAQDPGAAGAKAAPPPVPAAPADREPPAPGGEVAPDTQTVQGVVRDPSGKPIAGAMVYWTCPARPAATTIKALPRGEQNYDLKVLAEGKTDAEGRYEMRGRFTGGEVRQVANLVVVAPGYGLNGASRISPNGRAFADDKELVAITLRPEVKIKGQLLTPAGSPAKGVRVRLENIRIEGDGGVGIDSAFLKGSPPSYWPAAVTDEDGRFTLGGLPEGADAILDVSHDEFAAEQVLVSSRSDVKDDGQVLKPEFKHTLASGRPVQGVVTASDTGKPMAGVVVELHAAGRARSFIGEVRTDEQGRYRIMGPPAKPDPGTQSTYTVIAYPPADSGYIAVSDEHKGVWPPGAKFLEKNLALPRGRVLGGTVLDAETRKPIPGASVVYYAHIGNSSRRDNYDLRSPAIADKEGRFTITGLKGEGFLLVEGPSSGYARRMLPWREGLLGGDCFPHGYLKVDVPENDAPAPAEITLCKGVPLEARVVQPDGSAVPWVYAYCRGMNAVHAYRWDYSEPCEKGQFHMPGGNPKETYRVFFLQPELRLGAVVDLKAGEKPTEVRLQPTASVRAKLVAPDGSPAKGTWAGARLATVKEDDGKLDPFTREWMNRTMPYGEMAHADYGERRKSKDGDSILLENLIPGAPLYIEAFAGWASARQSVVLKPCEVKDLGTLKLARREARP
jgi:RNA polymerase sigma factor (sigma-70 family)